MSWYCNLLVVADRTIGSPTLFNALRERAAGGSIWVTIVAPAGRSRAATARQLDRVVDLLEDEGMFVSGVVGHPDPIVAVEEVWDPRRFDELLVITPAELTDWMELHLPRRLERFTGAEVTHVVATRPTPARPRRRAPRMPRAAV